jgi:hypothetical protein
MSDELKLRDEWMTEAKNQTLETLPAFLEKLSKHQHDYGTICRAIAAAGIAAMWALEKSPAGGITGFQAGCIIWDVIDAWGAFSSGPKRMVTYDELLYPQYKDKFKTISKDTWEWVQAEARKNLEKNGPAHERVQEHWRSIVNGSVPFGLVVGDQS